ncbi:MAG: hypothetical protein HAW62_01530 [Endozoicomonadaceae bacterium]|nr:hypothetical protein [Endozoicomonadaceae bacterium]
MILVYYVIKNNKCFIVNSKKDNENLAIQKALNNRPRKVLNYRTPNDVMLGIEKPLGVALHD